MHFYLPRASLRNAPGSIARGRTGYYQSKNSLRRNTLRRMGINYVTLNALLIPGEMFYTLKDVEFML